MREELRRTLRKWWMRIMVTTFVAMHVSLFLYVTFFTGHRHSPAPTCTEYEYTNYRCP